jgi:hypothetical protein
LVVLRALWGRSGAGGRDDEWLRTAEDIIVIEAKVSSFLGKKKKRKKYVPRFLSYLFCCLFSLFSVIAALIDLQMGCNHDTRAKSLEDDAKVTSEQAD